ncbi:MAG: alpha/beta fold hydrolase [Rhizobiaceae bacterium]
MVFESITHTINSQSIHTMVAGPEDAPVILMLHGFPEYWAAWSKVAEHFTATHRVVLPDQRGFNLSSKPQEEEAYKTKHLVADMVALMDQVSPHRPVILCGHDWGASVAYAIAMRHAQRVSHLIIANGVHPICFQKALYAAGPQTAASQYMNVLRAPGCEDRLSANRFEKLMGMLEKFSSCEWLDDQSRNDYQQAWRDRTTLRAMLNWYRQSPMVVPDIGEAAQEFPVTDEMREKFAVPMPHLLLWGLQDTALLPESRAELTQFCAQLELHEHEQASHWILHEEPDWVARNISKFLARNSN